MKLKTIFTIAKKEFFSYLNSPLSFVITVPFLLISIFIYMRTSLVVGEASLRPYFELLPWFLVLVSPAISMKLLTDEKKFGTIELLFAHPLNETELVLGKFLGCLFFFLFIMFTTLGLPISLLIFANPDPGVIVAQYLGAIFVGATFLSIGLAASSLVANPIGSFLLGAAGSFVLILFGLDFVTLMFPWPFSVFISEMAPLTHMSNIARGLLDIRDIFYFITVSALFLTAAVFKLSERKFQEDASEKRKLNLAFLLIAGIGVSLNIFLSYYPLRLDLTGQKLFTLSQGSRQTLKNLPDIVTISIFASRNLPSQMQLSLRDTQDVLKDYQWWSKKIVVKVLYPEVDPEAATQARQAGIQEVTFNRIGSGKFEVQSGFLGLTIAYGGKTEVIPFLEETADLEYQLTRRIRKLTSDKEKEIGVYKNTINRFSIVDQILTTEYKVTNLSLDDLVDKNKTKNMQAILLIDDGSSESTASAMLKNYLTDGGKAVILAEGVYINQQSLTGQKSKSSVTDFLSDWGVKVRKDIVYDLLLNEILTFGSGQMRYAAPYPFWIKAIIGDNSFAPTSGVKSVTLGWPSSLEITGKEGVARHDFLIASPNAGRLEESFNLMPTNTEKLPAPVKEKMVLATSLSKDNTQIVVVGDTDFASDQFLQNFSENAAVFANLMDYVAADKDLASIPRKTAVRPIFKFKGATGIIIFQYGNIIIPSLAVSLFAFFWLSRRKKLAQRKYEF